MSISRPLALVVEDDLPQAEIFTVALTQAGYEVVHIDNGNKALEYLDTHSPVLVLLDLHLPEVAGTTILKHIREQQHLNDTRVMLATADPHMASTVQAESDLVLIKPVSFTQLRSLAKRMLPSE